MPLYDFKCRSCELIFETLCTAADKAAGRVPCPSCASVDLERAYSRPAGVVVKSAAAAVPSCPSSGMSCPRAGMCAGH